MAEPMTGVAPTEFKGGLTAVVPPDFASVDRTIKREQDFNALTDRIKNVGGMETPEQRLGVIKDFKQLQPETSVWKAVAAKMMGVPDAGLIAVQGRITTTPEFDVNGKRLSAQYAQNNPNEPLQVWDENGVPLTREQYIARQGGQFKTFADTPAGQAKKIETEVRKGAYESEAAATNVQSAAARPLLDLHKQQQKDLQTLAQYGITSDDLTKLSSYSAGTVSYSQSLSDAFNTLKQAQNDKSKREELRKNGKLSASAGIIAGSAGIEKGKAESLGSSELDQLQKQLSSGQSLDTQFSQTKKEAFESAWYKNLPPEAKLVYENSFQRAANIAQLTGEASKYGDLAIAPSPYSPEIIRQAGSGELQSVLGQFKAEATLKFQEWRKEQKFPAGELPSPGQLQSAFTRTDEYIALKEKYGNMMDDVETRSVATIKANEEKVKNKPPSSTTMGTVTAGSASGKDIERKALPREVPPPSPKPTNAAPPPTSADRVRNLTQSILDSLKPKK
jgi:hypothetical protein